MFQHSDRMAYYIFLQKWDCTTAKKLQHNVWCFHNYFDIHNILYLHKITIDISRTYILLSIIFIIHVQIWNHVFGIIDYIKIFVMLSAYNYKISHFHIINCKSDEEILVLLIWNLSVNKNKLKLTHSIPSQNQPQNLFLEFHKF